MTVYVDPTTAKAIVASDSDLWPPDEAAFSLAYRRLLALLRLVRIVEDQLGVDHDAAIRIATGLIARELDDD